MVAVMPIMGHRAVPAQLKVALCLVLMVLVFPATKMAIPAVSTIPLELLFLILREVIIGLILGFVISIIFYAVQMAGQVIGIQTGYGIINLIDPMSDIEISLIGQLYYLTAILIFLGIDGHHFLLRALYLSYDYIPLANGALPARLVEKINLLTGATFDVSLRIAAPVMVALFLTDVVLGIMARVAPQMNVFLVGFPLKIGVGLLLITLVISFFPYIFGKILEQFQLDVVEVIRLLGR
jgi:flagellar biosynthetic protein FliR